MIKKVLGYKSAGYTLKDISERMGLSMNQVQYLIYSKKRKREEPDVDFIDVHQFNNKAQKHEAEILPPLSLWERIKGWFG
jgi:orotate phosphoribosyltransferase-like protein